MGDQNEEQPRLAASSQTTPDASATKGNVSIGNSQGKPQTAAFKRALRTALPVTGGIASIYLLLNGQWKGAVVSIALSLVIWILTVTGKFVQRIQEGVLTILYEEKAPHIARWIVDNGERFLSIAWWKVTSRFLRNYYGELVFKYRTYRTLGLKTRGKYSLDLIKVFVPLRVSPESPEQISSAIIRPQTANNHLSIWDFIAQMKRQNNYRRIAVIGAPGSGKTTLLEHLTLIYALSKQRGLSRKAPKLIPILLYLRDIRHHITGGKNPLLSHLIEQQDYVNKLNPKHNWFEHKLKGAQCLVMLDGLDEVADASERKEVSEWVSRQIQAYPNTPFLITSRPFGYLSAPIEHVDVVLEVQPLTIEQIEQFISSWYLQNESMQQMRKVDEGVRQIAKARADDLISRIKGHSPILSMAVNPLLLTMIATVHDNRGALPGRRVELYSEICDVLLGRRQEAKKLNDHLTTAQRKAVLQVLALELMRRRVREFSKDTASTIIYDVLATVTGSVVSALNFIEQIEKVSGLIIEKELGVFEFAHKSFQEYLAAVQVKEAGKVKLLASNINDPWWDETIRLYAAQGDATPIIEAALLSSTVTSLTLANECLEEGGRVHRDTRQKLEKILEAGLESPERAMASLAAQVKLSRRIRKLLPVNEKTEIDTSLVSCAEYQLFIDESNTSGGYRYPDHWGSNRFAKGVATNVVTGLRLEDAIDFCHWLTSHSGIPGATFRLPTIEEAQRFPLTPEGAGYWCSNSDGTYELIVENDVELGARQYICEIFVPTISKELGVDFATLPKLEPALNKITRILSDINLSSALMVDLTKLRGLDFGPALYGTFAESIAHTLGIHLRPLEEGALSERLTFLTRLSGRIVNEGTSSYYPNFADKLERAYRRPNLSTDEYFVRLYALLNCFFWSMLLDDLDNKSNRHQQDNDAVKTKYQMKLNTSIKAYIFFLLKQERFNKRLHSWEGVRIVRETLI